MNVKLRRTRLLLVGVAIGVAACSLARAAEISVAVEPQSARKPAPDFVLLDTSGRSVSLSSFKGKPLLLDLWATKCGGCIKEIPSFIEIHHAYASKGLAVVGISMDILYEDLKGSAEAWRLVNPFVDAHKVDYPILMGDESSRSAFRSTHSRSPTSSTDAAVLPPHTWVLCTAPTLKRTSRRFLRSAESNRTATIRANPAKLARSPNGFTNRLHAGIVVK